MYIYNCSTVVEYCGFPMAPLALCGALPYILLFLNETLFLTRVKKSSGFLSADIL